MNSRFPAPSWALLRGGVTGAGRKYCQDHATARPIADGRAVVLAVADGHGSAAHHRSDLGSRWAVEAFTSCAEKFAGEAVLLGDDPKHQPALLDTARALPRQVEHLWTERVLLHEANAPARGGLPEGPSAGPDPLAYASTLTGAVATDRLLVCWQLGGDDIVLVGQAGEPDTPLHEGPAPGDGTRTLGEPEAWRGTRVHWQPFTGGAPAASVILSTDGLSKGFADQQGFVGFARGLRDRVMEQGARAVQEQLEGWLSRAAAHSGDDATLVAAFPVPYRQAAPSQ